MLLTPHTARQQIVVLLNRVGVYSQAANSVIFSRAMGPIWRSMGAER